MKNNLVKIGEGSFPQARTPYKVICVTNYNCNLTCSYCNTHSLKVSPMKTDDYFGMFESLVELGTQQINFIGGEPFLRPDMDKLLARAKSVGLSTVMHSNGVFVREITDDTLAKIDLFVGCINGEKEIHDSIRGQGTFEKTVATLARMRSLGKPIVLDMILSSANANSQQIDYLFEFAADFDARICFQGVIEHKLVNAQSSLISGVQAQQRPLDIAWKYILELSNSDLGERIFNSQEFLHAMCNDPERKVNFARCHMADYACLVDPTGSLSQCYEFSLEPNRPNGLQLGWKEAWAALRKSDCLSCPYSVHVEDNVFFESMFQVVPRGRACSI